jgi:sulfoxide reductase heme-binding subunit YedZ
MSGAVGGSLFWIVSRAAGTTALVLASVTVCVGLVMGGRMVRGGNGDRQALHEILALSTLAALALHAFSLLGDHWLHPSLADVTIPFVAPYDRVWTAIGLIAGWMAIWLAAAFYFRDRIGRARFRVIHRLTVVVWGLGLLHAFMEGTDAGDAWFVALVIVTGSPGVVLLGLRLSGRPLPSLRRRAPARSPAPSA